jgi:hypothetical protein
MNELEFDPLRRNQRNVFGKRQRAARSYVRCMLSFRLLKIREIRLKLFSKKQDLCQKMTKASEGKVITKIGRALCLECRKGKVRKRSFY